MAKEQIIARITSIVLYLAIVGGCGYAVYHKLSPVYQTGREYIDSRPDLGDKYKTLTGPPVFYTEWYHQIMNRVFSVPLLFKRDIDSLLWGYVKRSDKKHPVLEWFLETDKWFT